MASTPERTDRIRDYPLPDHRGDQTDEDVGFVALLALISACFVIVMFLAGIGLALGKGLVEWLI